MKHAFAVLALSTSFLNHKAQAKNSMWPAVSSPLKRQLQQEQNDEGGGGGHSKNWWEFGLADPVLDEVALYYLGQSWHRSADVAEVLETIYRTNNSDPWSWTMEWRKTAQRMEALGKESEDAGHALSAGQAYLRAATYHRASLHRHPDPYHSEVADIAQRAVEAFEKFLTLSDYPCEPVRIPYEDTTLPGYLCLNPDVQDPAPTIIFNEGRDAWAEDGKFIVDEAMKRGYHVLLWDGPGMGRVIRLQGLPFRHDWENVLTPVIDYLVGLEEVDPDRLALISVSLGGFLGPRAAAFEHRLRALVANPGVMNWYTVYEDFLMEIDPGLPDLLESDPAAFDETVNQIMDMSDFFHWGLVDSMWHWGVDKPSEFMYEIRRYTMEGLAQNITTATLVIDAEAETRGQAIDLYEALTGTQNKEYILFTAEEAAQFHVQIGATAILTMRTMNWLDDVLLMEEEGDGPEVQNTSYAWAQSKLSLLVVFVLLSCSLFML